MNVRHPRYDSDTKEVVLDGEVIGHVVRRSRVVRGVKNDRGTLAAGTRAHFWTAVPLQRPLQAPGAWWWPGDGASIGTRFESSRVAILALVQFHARFRPHYAECWWRDGEEMREWRKYRKRHWGF